MPQGSFLVNKLRSAKAFGSDSGSVTEDLPTSNYLNSIMLRVENTNGATSNTGQTIATEIDKIVVEADGIPVFSISGEAAKDFEHADAGKRLPYNETQAASGVQYQNFMIYFGVNDNDKDHLLPSHKFATLQLKIDFSFTDSGTTGYATSETNAKYDLFTRILVPNVNDVLVDTPFLRKKEVYSKTWSTIQEENVEFAVGSGQGAIRRIMIRAYEAAIEDGVDVDKYELIINDNQTILNELWNTSQIEDSVRYGASGDKAVLIMKANNGTYDSKCSRIRALSISPGTAARQTLVDSIAGDRLTLDVNDLATPTAITAVIGHRVIINCDGVPYCTFIDLGVDDIEDSLDVGAGSGVSSLKLKCNVAAAGAAVKVVTEEVVFF